MLHKAFALLLAARIFAPVLLSALKALAPTFVVGLSHYIAAADVGEFDIYSLVFAEDLPLLVVKCARLLCCWR